MVHVLRGECQRWELRQYGWRLSKLTRGRNNVRIAVLQHVFGQYSSRSPERMAFDSEHVWRMVGGGGQTGLPVLSDPCLGALGNLGRNTFVGPGFWSSDLTLSKKFKLTERFNLKFDAAAFNIFNRANFVLATTGGGAHNEIHGRHFRRGGRYHGWQYRTAYHAVRLEAQLLAALLPGACSRRRTGPFSFVGLVDGSHAVNSHVLRRL